ncbi:MAG: GNAT family N-acetyltransferase [Clostridia bacterium]|nr:GNAT family N-acetyltransferase [Clostridia bacterium]
MNTLKYGSEHIDGVEGLLRRGNNRVDLPSDVYFDIARVMSEEQTDKQKLHKLIAKTFSVLAFENDELVGFASMDKEGNAGILVTASGEYSEKAAKSLLKALERRAAKKELPRIYVLQTTESDEFFRKNGYAPMENPSGYGVNEGILVKEIAPKDEFTITPDRVRKIRLDPSKPIKVESKIVVFPKVFLIVACFFVVLLTAIAVAEYVKNGSLDSKFNLFFIVFGVLFAAALALFIAYMMRGARVKRESLERMEVTNGIVTEGTVHTRYVQDSDGNRDSREDVGVYYVFYDGDIKREGSFTRTYSHFNSQFFKGQEVIIAYDEDKSYLLTKYTIMDEMPAKPNASRSVPAEETEESEEGAEVEESAESTKQEKSGKTPRARRINDISEYMPVKESKLFYLTGIVLLSMCLVAIAVSFVALFIMTSNSDVSFSTLWDGMRWFIVAVAVLPGGIGLVYLLIPLSARLKFKALLKTDYVAVKGELICSETTYRGNGSPSYTCKYVDTDGDTHVIKISSMYVRRRVQDGKTDVVVAYNYKTAIILVKKYKLPIRLR